MRRNVFHHNTAGSDYAIIADGDAGQNAYIGTNPHITADSYRTGVFETLVPLDGIDRMTCRVKPAIGSDKHVVAEFYRSLVKYHQIMIGIEIFADMDIVAVIA